MGSRVILQAFHGYTPSKDPSQGGSEYCCPCNYQRRRRHGVLRHLGILGDIIGLMHLKLAYWSELIMTIDLERCWPRG